MDSNRKIANVRSGRVGDTGGSRGVPKQGDRADKEADKREDGYPEGDSLAADLTEDG